MECFEIGLTSPEVKHLPSALLTFLCIRPNVPAWYLGLRLWGVKAYPAFDRQVKPGHLGVGSKKGAEAGLGWSEVEREGQQQSQLPAFIESVVHAVCKRTYFALIKLYV